VTTSKSVYNFYTKVTCRAIYSATASEDVQWIQTYSTKKNGSRYIETWMQKSYHNEQKFENNVTI
jgi:hypothetical protein